jgi:uncharacterized protein (TIGR03437 family)
MLAQPNVRAVLNAASYSSSLAPGTWTVIQGAELAPGPASSDNPAAALNGVSVTIGGIAAPLVSVAPDQLNALIPFEVAELRFGQQAEVPVLVTTPAGTSSPFSIKLSRNAPGIYTQNREGTGDAVVSDVNLDPVSTVGVDPILLRATGLGPLSSEPQGRVVDSVQVFIGDQPADLTLAGPSGVPGIYLLNATPKTPISNRVYLRVNGVQSNIATLPIPVGLNVTNAAGSIGGLYPASGAAPTSGPVSFSAMLVAGTFTASFDLLPNARPFSVIARAGTGPAFVSSSAVIHIDPLQNTWQAGLTVPTAAARLYDFSDSGPVVLDFLTGRTFPGGIVPLSRQDPAALNAIRLLSLPNAEFRPATNAILVASGVLPPGGHFTIDSNILSELSNFGGFTEITRQGGLPLTATFQLFVDGLLVASREITYPVI